MNTPVLFIIFNRTDTALQVFETIRRAQPKRLYFFADAPRANVPGESEKCDQAKEIVSMVDWPCEVQTFFLTQNIGPRLAIGKAISWFFENEEEGIILEHDCLPSQSFYTFCETLLAHYRNDERVMHISGDNFQYGIQRGDASYYFSLYNHIWGFATWRRAWKYYDVEMKRYPAFKKEGKLRKLFNNRRAYSYWAKILQLTYEQKLQTWDYQWTFAMWERNALAILPQLNMVSNIGFGTEALNTKSADSKYAAIPRHEILNIRHPSHILADVEADNYAINRIFNPSIITLAKNKLQKWFLTR